MSGPIDGAGGLMRFDDPPAGPAFDARLAAATIRRNAYPASRGMCARAVRLALEAGGLDTKGHPASASGYPGFLRQLGFGIAGWYPSSAEPFAAGDVVCLPALPEMRHGHVAMFDGNAWVSDFVQRDIWGGPAWRAQGVTSGIYRWGVATEVA